MPGLCSGCVRAPHSWVPGEPQLQSVTCTRIHRGGSRASLVIVITGHAGLLPNVIRAGVLKVLGAVYSRMAQWNSAIDAAFTELSLGTTRDAACEAQLLAEASKSDATRLRCCTSKILHVAGGDSLTALSASTCAAESRNERSLVAEY